MVVSKAFANRGYDIVIVGGGILGVFCAYYANQKWPKKKIAILEKKMVGKGVTDYSACLDVPYSTTPYKRELTIKSRILYDELLDKYPQLPIASTSVIGICKKNQVKEIIGQLSSKGAIIGERAKFNTHAPVDFHLTEQYGYFYNVSGYYAYSNVTNVIAAELVKKENVTIYESTEVVAVIDKEEGCLIQTNYGLTLETTAMIDATGPWMTKGFSSENLVSQNLRTKKIIALHIDSVPPKNAPIVYCFNDDAFLCPQPHFSRWLFSYRCEDWDVDIDKDEFKITNKNLSKALAVLNKYSDSMGDKITGGRVYCDMYSSNGDPLVKKTRPNYIIVGAPSGSGYRLAPGLAEEVVSLLEL